MIARVILWSLLVLVVFGAAVLVAMLANSLS